MPKINWRPLLGGVIMLAITAIIDISGLMQFDPMVYSTIIGTMAALMMERKQ